MTDSKSQTKLVSGNLKSDKGIVWYSISTTVPGILYIRLIAVQLVLKYCS